MAITPDEIKAIGRVIKRHTEGVSEHLLDLLSNMERVLAEQRERLNKLERSHGSRLAELENEVRIGNALRALEARVGELEQRGEAADD